MKTQRLWKNKQTKKKKEGKTKWPEETNMINILVY